MQRQQFVIIGGIWRSEKDFLGFNFRLSDSGKVVKRLRPLVKRKFRRRISEIMKQYAGRSTRWNISRTTEHEGWFNCVRICGIIPGQ